MARALAWHARGRRFDPDTLHKGSHKWAFYFMAYSVYIIYSLKLDEYYFGSCNNIEIRMLKHMTGRNCAIV